MKTMSNADGISRDKILFYASSKHGMSLDECTTPATMGRVLVLVAEGKLEIRERTVDVPGFNMPESCKAVSMFDTWSARTVFVRTAHLLSY